MARSKMLLLVTLLSLPFQNPASACTGQQIITNNGITPIYTGSVPRTYRICRSAVGFVSKLPLEILVDGAVAVTLPPDTGDRATDVNGKKIELRIAARITVTYTEV